MNSSRSFIASQHRTRHCSIADVFNTKFINPGVVSGSDTGCQISLLATNLDDDIAVEAFTV